MSNRTVYQLSARQVLLLAFATALVAVGATLLLANLGNLFRTGNGSEITFAESAAAGISNPAEVSDEQNSIDVYKVTAPGVAFISTTSYSQDMWGDVNEGRGNGSGSVIDANGHILTNYHVVERAQKLTVNFGGDQVYTARMIGGDPDTDLAVIKLDSPPAGLTVVPLGDSDKLSVGQKVLAIGNPFGLDRTLTTGVISGLQRPIRARNGRPIDAAIQTDASINPGNSGGPLLDKFGRMIGINSQILSPAGGSVGVGFAVPVNTAKRIIPQLIQHGSVRRPKLSADLLSVKTLTERGISLPVRTGVLVRNAISGGAAANAGIRGLSQDQSGEVVLGDIITSIDGEKVDDNDSVYRILDRKNIGDMVNVELYRDGRTMTVPVKLLPPATQSQRSTTRRTQE